VAETQVETETKFDVAPDFVLGDLTGLLAKGGHLQTSSVDMVSTYHDTAQLALLRSHLTLRRRTGEADTGWHLKVPGKGFRTELRWPLNEPDTIPADLARLVAPFSNGSPIHEIVQLKVLRTRHQIVDADGRLRLEIADDEVRASGVGGTSVVVARWREIEAELGPAGSDTDLVAAGKLLTGQGAFPSGSSSKLARALRGNPAPSHPRDTAGAVLHEYLSAQCDALTAGHFAVSLKPFEPDSTKDPHEAVHQTRVASRRLRALLRTFGPLFDAGRAAQLEAELRWFAAELGEVRDREVLRARLARAVDELPAYLVVGPVAKRIDDVLLSELEQHTRALLATMADVRYRILIADLAEWNQAPPFTPLASKPTRTLNDHVLAAEKKLEKRMKAASAADVEEEKLHSARKQGKRVRYAAEAAGPALGPHARGLVKAAATLQTLLGEHQDSIVATELLRRIAEQAAEDGENTFTYGILVGDQRRSAADSARAAREAAARR